MSAVTKIRLDYNDLQHFPDDGKRHELIDGDHIMTPSPNTAHQWASGNLFALLHANISRRNLGRVFAAPFDVVFSPYDVVEPDILFISNERVGILTLNNVQGAPDLVVEVISPNTETVDRQEKFHLYEKFGVLEYWIVDPSAETAEVYSLHDQHFISLGRFSGDETIQSRVLSGFECRISEVFGQ